MLLAVHVIIALHITHWLIAGRTVTPVEPSEAMALGRDGVVNAGVIFFAAAILLTAVFGRFFCGWACHLVALQDGCLWLLRRLGIRPVPLRSRLLRWVPVLAFVYMFLWPAIYRWLAREPWPGLHTEWTTSDFWATFPGWLVALVTFLVCGFACVYFLGAKGFCTYACPYGAAFAAADRLAPLRIRVTDACSGCGHCTATCTSNVRVHQEVRDWGMVVDSGCMRCQDCISVCPNQALYYGSGPIPLLATPRVPNPEPRRYPLAAWEEALLAIAFALAFFSFRGLYGEVPFLLSLGWAGVLAVSSWLAVRLWVQPTVTFRRLALRRGGRLRPAGWSFVVVFGALLGLWFHSAVHRYHDVLGQRAYRATAELRRQVAIGEGELVLTAADRRDVAVGRFHLGRVRDWGLVPTRGNARRLAWLHRLAPADGALRRAATTALERGERPEEMHLLLAREARDRGALEAARRHYRGWIEAAPGRPTAYVELARLLAEAGDLAAAGEVLEAALGAAPGAAAVRYNLAVLRVMEGHLGEAIARFEETLELAPDHRAARENLAAALARVGRFDDSLGWLPEEPGDTAERWLQRAEILAAAGRWEEARRQARRALELAPGWSPAVGLMEQLDRRLDDTKAPSG